MRTVIIAAIFLFLSNVITAQSSFLSEFKTDSIKVNNYNIHYLKKGEGKPIILIHGGGTWMYSWRNNINILSEKYTVYAIDMPGHGYTRADDEPEYKLDDFADFIKAFMATQGLSKATIIGNSWGGGWAIYFTQKYPLSVDKLILIDASGLNIKDVFEWEILKKPVIGNMAVKFVNRKMVKDQYEKVYYNSKMVTDDVIDETYAPLKFERNKRSMFLIERNCDWKVTEDYLPKINKPVLIIWGENDKFIDVKYAKRMNELIPGSELMLIPICGHTPQEEKSNMVNSLIIQFLSK